VKLLWVYIFPQICMGMILWKINRTELLPIIGHINLLLSPFILEFQKLWIIILYHITLDISIKSGYLLISWEIYYCLTPFLIFLFAIYFFRWFSILFVSFTVVNRRKRIFFYLFLPYFVNRFFLICIFFVSNVYCIRWNSTIII